MIGKGLPHNCTPSTKAANMKSLLTVKEREQIAADVIKEKASSSVSLSTHGSNLKVSLPPPPSKTRAPGQISASTLMARMKNTRASFRGLKEYSESLLIMYNLSV